jgi:predicted transport protein
LLWPLPDRTAPGRHDQWLLAQAGCFLFGTVRPCTIDPSVGEQAYVDEVWPFAHISYQSASTFVDAVPQTPFIRLILNVRPDQLDDPQDITHDVTGMKYWGGGDVRVRLSADHQLEYALGLIHQALALQLNDIAA